MTPEQLWNDRTFFTLLTDVWKARKDAVLGPVRLDMLLSYAKSHSDVPPVASFSSAQGSAAFPVAIPKVIAQPYLKLTL